jgi:predicted Zn-dependent protease
VPKHHKLVKKLARRRWTQPINFLVLAIAVFLLGLNAQSVPVLAQADSQPGEVLPVFQVHPLPATLAQWQDVQNQGDYFSEIRSTPVGYLIWSEFPVQVFVEPVLADAATASRDQAWSQAVISAMQEWNRYLPLQLCDTAEEADIAIWRTSPPLQWSDPEADNPASRLGRVRSAETRYELYIDRPAAPNPARLSHRFQILLRPSQAPTYLQAAIRHELGHALGIWGHSPLETDALYFSQVRNPPAISSRDVNTLKRVYQQPTRLGWSVTPGGSVIPEDSF